MGAVGRFCPDCPLSLREESDWKSHKRSCKPSTEEGSTATVKPLYFDAGDYNINPAELARAIVNSQNPAPIPQLMSKPRKEMKDIPLDLSDGRQFIVKVQLFVQVSGGRMLVYNHKRDFRCHIEREENEAQYDRLKAVISAKGAVNGMKAYFMAELKNKGELVVQTEVISEQAW